MKLYPAGMSERFRCRFRELRLVRLGDLAKSILRPRTLRGLLGRCDFHGFLTRLLSISPEEVDELRQEIIANDDFYHALNESCIPVCARRLGAGPYGGGKVREAMYVAVRVLKPEVVFETGVFHGLSSAFLLQALEANGKGKLVSIDLPTYESVPDSTSADMGTLPKGRQPGWAVPDYLRHRHTLLLGDSRELLGKALEDEGTIGLFCHDSLHTYDHMMWEYEQAWPHLAKGGVLLSDDVFGWAARNVFFRFAKKVGGPTAVLVKLGGVRKV